MLVMQIMFLVYCILSYPLNFVFMRYCTPRPDSDNEWFPWFLFLVSPFGFPCLLFVWMCAEGASFFADSVWGKVK